jgi:hypothetical protein
LGWSDIAGFLVEDTYVSFVKLHRVVILRYNGRALKPWALVFDDPRRAEAVRDHLLEQRVTGVHAPSPGRGRQ